MSIHEGTIAGVSVAALFSGVCKVNAALAAQLLIDTCHVDAILNSGTAGGLSPALSPFDTVIGSETAYHDVAEDILTEFHPWLDSIWFPADMRLLSLARTAAQKAGLPCRTGRMVTGETFVTNRIRDAIIEKYHPLTVDMETASIAHVCYANSLPFLSIRTVTDAADQRSTEDFEANCRKASETAAQLCAALLREIALADREA